MKNKQNEYKNRITDTNHITMTPFLSQKIKLLSLISIILVLYIHSGFHDYPNEIQGMPFNFKLQDFISGKIGRCAVPLFYAISGYLFFLNLNNKNILWAKIKKRIMTLVVPYIIAALFFPCFYIIVSLIPVQPVSLIQKVYQPYSTYLYGIYFNLYFMILWLSTFGSYEI